MRTSNKGLKESRLSKESSRQERLISTNLTIIKEPLMNMFKKSWKLRNQLRSIMMRHVNIKIGM
jgi:hypothetical protein